ncbi:progesterone receptor isoform X2 [Bos indicus x Bos taurus]|uniref:Progesterone receptor n=1 Tax=Bos indicus x Bos taurus TaxID=30522 RepID=A0A4W2G326_BOBOX|nr:progesterone receptor isoform X2 [Bos indicus x Bos taurus]
MTELKAKGPRAPHVAGTAPSPTQAGAPLRGRPDAGPFQAGEASGPTPTASGLPLSLDGLIFPRSCQAQDLDGKTPDPESLADVEGAYSGGEAAEGAAARPPEKDGGLLDSVLDTLLAPPGPERSPASPAVCEAPSPWCLFGPELVQDARAAPAAQGVLLPLMSRPESKAGDTPGAAAGQKVLPRGLAPCRQLLAPTASSHPWPAPAPRPSPQPAVVELEEDDSDPEGSSGPPLKGKARPAGGDAISAPGTAAGGVAPVPKEDARFSAPRAAPAEHDAPAAPGRASVATAVMDFIHVPILPLNSAFLAARTRQLLEGDSYDGGAAGAFAPPRGSPSASAALGAPGDFPDCAYQPDSEPKDDAFSLYGDPQPPALKIKEEEEGGAEAAARSPRPYLLAGASPAVFADFPLAPPSRPGEVAVPAAATGAPGSSAAVSGSALECVLYKAEGAPPQPGPFAPPPCKAPAAGACLLPRDLPSTSAAAAAAAAGATPALYQPLGLNGLPQLGYQAAVLKEGLPQVYQPDLNYLRPDSEASQSPQYSFESLPQKICLICGDEASGCHYGVLTCGSCKVFFKRAMEGRKFKKFNKVRVMRTLDAVALPQPVGIPNESQALSQRITFSPSQDLQLIPPLINLLMSIEPDVVYAGHDNSKPDTSSSLLTSLNQLGERQLLSVVKWSKSLPGFRNLHIDDQITLIQYSWMSLMVFGLGWRSYKHVSGQMLYFAPDLILNEQRMKESSFYSLCLTMWQIPQEFVKLQVSQEEFLCMKVLLLLNTIPLEGLRSQNQFEEMRSSYIRELIKAIGLRQKGVVPSSQRFYQLTKLLDNLHDLVKQLHLYCLNTFIQSRALSVEFPEMMSEVIAAQLPKILAGMVKPLLFHKK